MTLIDRHQAAILWAESFDSNLQATDPRFFRTMTVEHLDGSVLKFRRAFALRYDIFLVVFTEHLRYHVYPIDELESFTQHVEIPVEEVTS